MSKKIIITLIAVLLAAVLLVVAIVSIVKSSNDSKPENTDETAAVDKGEESKQLQTAVDDSDSETPSTTGKPSETSISTDKTEATTDAAESGESTRPTPETSTPSVNTPSNGGASNDAPVTELSPIVPIPPETDDTTGEKAVIKFPCEVEGYGLVLEKLAHYKGTFVEDGTNVELDSVAMLLVVNNGKYPIEYAQISVQYGEESLLFDITALPVGEKLVVQEKTGKSIPAGEANAATAMVLQEAVLDLSSESISVVDNGDNTLTVKNLTDKTIPTVRIFYKYYMSEENVFVGGISFTVKLTRMGAGESITIQPSHYTSKTSKVVMVLTYDSEV